MTDPRHPDDQRLQEALDDTLMTTLRSAIAEQAAQMDPEHGLAQLHQRLQGKTEKASLWRRVLDRLAWPALAPLTITALASVCIAQSWLLRQAYSPELADEPLAWRSVNGGAPATANLRIHFKPGATVAQVSAALEVAQAAMMAGPLSDGSYLLDAADAQTARSSLQSNSAVSEVTMMAGPAKP
ncbi:hypothetical protein [Janthinobacterium aquaticum]|uniref:hypothetical protein n=1 Tax=Janthinobacterium sp. FT58W TaxID=2654254 RepID=UPI00186B361A|nr:hypothetical protein [Janthinobacterium sp. FT58W]